MTPAAGPIPTPRPWRTVVPAAWAAVLATVAALLFLAALHVLSPQFNPSWRMVSEYAFGHYAWVLSLMFLCWGIGSWALAAALWPLIHIGRAKAGLLLLIVAGTGEAMASVFDVTHPLGHGVAGILGVLGFPIAALLLSSGPGAAALWLGRKRTLLALANLSWVSVLLLIASLTLMTVQFAHANGGHLPSRAPKVLPPGVWGIDGWADRLIVLTNCAWVILAAGSLLRRRPSPNA